MSCTERFFLPTLLPAHVTMVTSTLVKQLETKQKVNLVWRITKRARKSNIKLERTLFKDEESPHTIGCLYWHLNLNVWLLGVEGPGVVVTSVKEKSIHICTVNFTYSEQVYNEILLVMKSYESPGRSPITLHWVLYVCNEFVYNELSALTKPSRCPLVMVFSIFSPVVTKYCTGIPT